MKDVYEILPPVPANNSPRWHPSSITPLRVCKTILYTMHAVWCKTLCLMHTRRTPCMCLVPKWSDEWFKCSWYTCYSMRVVDACVIIVICRIGITEMWQKSVYEFSLSSEHAPGLVSEGEWERERESEKARERGREREISLGTVIY